MPVAYPDRMEVHRPVQCQCCGRIFAADEPCEVIQCRQVFDLPEPKLEVTEHPLGQITCCGVAQRGDYPAGVNAAVQYGPGVRALATLLSIDHKMPLEKISQLFEDLYGEDLNRGTVLDTLERGYAHAAPLQAATMARLREADVVHFDETGIRVAGQPYWLHTASTSDHTHLFVHKKRGQEALASTASILKDFTATAVHDCWASYFKFTDARYVLCGAHLLRELNGLKADGSQWAEAMHEFLRPAQEAASDRSGRRGPEALPDDSRAGRAGRTAPPAQPAWETQANAGAQPPGSLANSPRRGHRLCLGSRGPVHE
jgi:transposase